MVPITLTHDPLPGWRFRCNGHLPARRQPTTTRGGSNGGEARLSVLAALPDFGSRMLSASAVVAYVAVGAAAILSRSVTEAARDALMTRSALLLDSHRA